MSTTQNSVLGSLGKHAFSCKYFHKKQDKAHLISFHQFVLFISLGKLWGVLGNSNDGSVYQRITLYL